MQLSMHSALMFVPNLDVARDFHEGVLGLDLDLLGEGFHIFRGEDFRPAAFLGKTDLSANEYFQDPGSSVAFAVPDLDAAFCELAAEGVRFLHTPQ